MWFLVLGFLGVASAYTYSVVETKAGLYADENSYVAFPTGTFDCSNIESTGLTKEEIEISDGKDNCVIPCARACFAEPSKTFTNETVGVGIHPKTNKCYCTTTSISLGLSLKRVIQRSDYWIQIDVDRVKDGCMVPYATNYDLTATYEDRSCNFNQTGLDVAVADAISKLDKTQLMEAYAEYCE